MGADLLCHTEVTGFNKENNRIKTVRLINTSTGKEISVEPEQVINAAGAWVTEVAALAGIDIDMLYSKGTLLVTGHRVTDRVVNRLRPPSDGDILVPGGTVSLLGATLVRIDSLDRIRPTIEEVDLIVDEGSGMIPALRSIRYIRSYAGVRPLPTCRSWPRGMWPSRSSGTRHLSRQWLHPDPRSMRTEHPNGAWLPRPTDPTGKRG